MRHAGVFFLKRRELSSRAWALPRRVAGSWRFRRLERSVRSRPTGARSARAVLVRHLRGAPRCAISALLGGQAKPVSTLFREHLDDDQGELIRPPVQSVPLSTSFARTSDEHPPRPSLVSDSADLDETAWKRRSRRPVVAVACDAVVSALVRVPWRCGGGAAACRRVVWGRRRPREPRRAERCGRRCGGSAGERVQPAAPPASSTWGARRSLTRSRDWIVSDGEEVCRR